MKNILKEIPKYVETVNIENQTTTDPRFKTLILTQKDDENIELIKKIISEYYYYIKTEKMSTERPTM